jgi:hypothetical protein
MHSGQEGPDLALKKNFQMRVMFSLGQVTPVASAADSALRALNQVSSLTTAARAAAGSPSGYPEEVFVQRLLIRVRAELVL